MASVAELEERLEEIEVRLKEIDSEHNGERLSDEAKAEWNRLMDEQTETAETIVELQKRSETLLELAESSSHSEAAVAPAKKGPRRGSHVPDDPTQLHEYRTMATGMDDLEQAYRDGAMQILERHFRPAHPDISTEEAQDNVSRMLDTIDEARGEDGPRSLARRVIATSSKGYGKEFTNYLRSGGRSVGKEMERAASLTAGSGGYAVPVILDPTVILVSAGVTNPVRSIARVERVVGNTWQGITSTGITAAYSAEATETTDNAPSLVQPVLNVEKAQALVPYSIEIGEDWAGFQSSMAMLFQDAKDTLENTKFQRGLGHASNEPLGLIAPLGATAIVTTATTAVIAAADIYSMENGLAERWLRRASFVGSRAFFQKIRQLDTQGGANLWVQLQNANPPELIGYPSYVWSAYSSAVTTSGSTVATLGDFNEFLIVDRVGLGVEVIPHLTGTVANFPTGQRGLYMYWRNSSRPLTPALQANSAFLSLKVL